MVRLFFPIFLLLTGCGSVRYAAQGVKPGMDKAEVLEKAGNPKQTYRDNNQDHWVYVFFHKDQEWRREVIFANGEVVRVTAPINKDSYERDLERSKTMEEYEGKVRSHQKKSLEGFVTIDGLPGDPTILE